MQLHVQQPCLTRELLSRYFFWILLEFSGHFLKDTFLKDCFERLPPGKITKHDSHIQNSVKDLKWRLS